MSFKSLASGVLCTGVSIGRAGCVMFGLGSLASSLVEREGTPGTRLNIENI
jgi:hypothetical protein